MVNEELFISRLKKRPVFGVLLLQIITFGLYEIYWLFSIRSQINDLSDTGQSRVATAVRQIVFVLSGVFLKILLLLSYFSSDHGSFSSIHILLAFAISSLFFGFYSLHALSSLEKLSGRKFATSIAIKKVLSFAFGVYFLQYKINILKTHELTIADRKLVANDMPEFATGMLFLSFFCVLNIGLALFSSHGVAIQISHMLPTIKPNEAVIVNEKAYSQIEDLEYGDLVYIRTGVKEVPGIISRVIGLPGDSVEVRHGQVILNGKTLKQTKSTYKTPKIPSQYRIADIEMKDEVNGSNTYQLFFFNKLDLISQPRDWVLQDNKVVPADQVFILGDFRDIAVDSRIIHFVDFQHIAGKINEQSTKFFEWKLNTAH